MRFSLAKNWWSLVIRGFLGIAVGILAFLWPGMALVALVFLFAGYALVDGVVSLAGALHAVAAHERWGALLLEGCIGIAAAVITALWPTITVLGLVLMIGAWGIIRGIAEITSAVRLQHRISGEWLLVGSGILSVTFGLLVTIAPLIGAMVIAIWFGAYAFLSGVLLVMLGYRLRMWDRTLLTGTGVPAPAH